MKSNQHYFTFAKFLFWKHYNIFHWNMIFLKLTIFKKIIFLFSLEYDFLKICNLEK